MFLNSIRWRLQLWHGILLVVVLTGFGVTAYQLQRATQLRRIDEELQQRVGAASALARRPNEGPGRPPPDRFRPPIPPPPSRPGVPRDNNQGDGVGEPVREEEPFRSGDGKSGPEARFNVPPPQRFPPPRGQGSISAELPRLQREFHLPPQALRLFEATGTNSYYYVVWGRDGKVMSQSDTTPSGVPWPGESAEPGRIFTRGPEPNQTRMRDNHREMFHYTPMGDCILAGINISFQLSEMRRFAGLLLAAGSGVLMVGLAGGWWLSSRAIRPIKIISATAARIATGDLSQRIPVKHSENELDQLASVLNSTFSRLDAVFAQQAQFTSDAAHELRTPVSVILTQTQSVLARERSLPEYRESLAACQRAAQRMRRLIESLLELARLDAGQGLNKESVDLGKVIAECVELLRPLADERNIALRSSISFVSCVGNADQLKQVFTNLISNAIYYNKGGGEVRIHVEKDNDSAIITVADTGIGISAEHLPHVFERFWRADQSRTRADGRSGLGLAIVKAIVEAHLGSIVVTSELEKGSTFIIRLPGGEGLEGAKQANAETEKK